MSDGLPKPTSVEVGQWWVVPRGVGPFRVEAISEVWGTAIHSDGHGESSREWLMEHGTYLGAGENPAPSEWMVERLIEHGHYAQSGEPLGEPRRTTAADRVRELLQGDEPTNYFDRAVVSLYRILRDLGKW